MKRSELERISTGEEPPEEEAVTTPTPSTSILQSPTSLVPVEDSPIFSIPKSEVSQLPRFFTNMLVSTGLRNI